MTTAGFVSGADEDCTPTGLTRCAAGLSILLGVALLVVLPDLVAAAGYVGVLAGFAAAVALLGGYALWTRVSLLTRAVAGVAATITAAIWLLELVLGLPGTADDDPAMAEGGFALLLSLVVLVLLLADALRRRPVHASDHPYAL